MISLPQNDVVSLFISIIYVKNIFLRELYQPPYTVTNKKMYMENFATSAWYEL